MNSRLRSLRPDVLSAALVTLLGAAAGAQSAAPAHASRGVIAGEVVDAETLYPLRGATVVLLPAPTGVLPPAVTSTSSSFLSLARSVVTGDLGTYRFGDLPLGEYHLRVQRVGYRPVTLDVHLRGSDDARLSVGLTVAPIRLQALTVRADSTPPYGRVEARTAETELSRVEAARLRQRLYLGADVREVTHPDVVEAVTLGAADLFRAFHRLPGVTTRDDDAAELWTRGSRPDLTRVYFDGLPLFSPLHAFGSLSAVPTTAVGAAFLHPGVRPAWMGEGGAAVVDIRSRPGGGAGALRGIGEIALGAGVYTSIGARGALDQRVGHSSWMLAGGRSVTDLLFGLAHNGTRAIGAPAFFGDLAGRFDHDFGRGRRLELSGLWLRDLRSDDPEAFFDVVRRFDWGSHVGRASLEWPVAGLRSRHTIGISQSVARVDTIANPRIDPGDSDSWWMGTSRELPLRSSVVHASLSGAFEPARRTGAGAPAPWAVGYELAARRVEFDGDMRYVLFRIESATSRREQSTSTGSVWGTWRLRPTDRLLLEPGLRLDVGSSLANAGVVRPMPRIQARFALDSQTALSAGVGRSFQYTQGVGRVERGQDAVVFPTPVWLAADRSTPALRADVLTLGVERWMTGSWLAAANLYRRSSTGYLLRDPTPGPLAERGGVVEGRERASGLELSARRLSGRVTGSAAYTFSVARTAVAGLDFPSAQDRRHAFDLTVLGRLKPTLHVSAAYTYATGAPYTRLRSMNAAPDQGIYDPPPDSLIADAPNALRMPHYASLDLAVDWSFRAGPVNAGAFLQLRNALRRNNRGLYYGLTACEDCGDAFLSSTGRDLLLPVFGLRARF